METPQQEPRKIGGLDITRSIQDRIFLGVMGFIFMVLTGFVLYTYCTSPSPPCQRTVKTSQGGSNENQPL
jgi:hypothetical protein